MTLQQLLKARSICKKAKAKADKVYLKSVDVFCKKYSPVKTGKVYNLVSNGIRRRGYSRIVIYARKVIVFDRNAMIQIGGWWLDENGVPGKWDQMIVYGVSNPAVFELCGDQVHHPHPSK